MLALTEPKAVIRDRLASFWRIIINNTNQANNIKTEHLTIEQLHLNVHTCNYILLYTVRPVLAVDLFWLYWRI